MEISEDQNTITTDDGLIHKADSFYDESECNMCSLLNYGICCDIPCDTYERVDSRSIHFITLNGVNNDHTKGNV